MNTATTANQRQIMLCFAYLAYLGETITSTDPGFATADETIYGYLNGAMSGSAASPLAPINAPNDTWEVVWGPVVYTVPGALYQDNMMYVVQNLADTSQYAIAIRGTNFSSDLDWLLEDFDVLQMMPWPNVPGAMISESTNIGLQILLNMQGALNGNFTSGYTSSLLAFLWNTTNNKDKITLGVTGHSLGGCLAATLALYLNDNPSLWDACYDTNPSSLYAITFAAPTAGNESFANYSNQQFKNQYNKSSGPNWNPQIPTNCDVVQCSLDLVPLMWQSNNIYNGSASPLFNIYSPLNTNASPPLTDPPYSSQAAGNGLDFGYAGALLSANANLSFLYREAWANIIVPDMLPALAAMLSTANTQYTQLEAYNILQGAFYNSPPPPNTAAFAWPEGFSFPLAHEEGGDNTLTVFMQAFAAEAGLQHSYSYPQLLGVTNLNQVVYNINNT